MDAPVLYVQVNYLRQQKLVSLAYNQASLLEQDVVGVEFSECPSETVRVQLLGLRPVAGASICLQFGNEFWSFLIKQDLVIYIPSKQFSLFAYNNNFYSITEEIISTSEIKLQKNENNLIAVRTLEYYKEIEKELEGTDVFNEIVESAKLKEIENELDVHDVQEVQLKLLVSRMKQQDDIFQQLKSLSTNKSYLALQFTRPLREGYVAISPRNMQYQDIVDNEQSLLKLYTNFNQNELLVLDCNQSGMISERFDTEQTYYIIMQDETARFSINSQMIYAQIQQMRPFYAVNGFVRMHFQDLIYEDECRIRADLFKGAEIRRLRRDLQAESERLLEYQREISAFPRGGQQRFKQLKAAFLRQYQLLYQIVRNENAVSHRLQAEIAGLVERKASLQRDAVQLQRQIEATEMQRFERKRALLKQRRDALPQNSAERKSIDEELRIYYVKQITAQSEFQRAKRAIEAEQEAEKRQKEVQRQKQREAQERGESEERQKQLDLRLQELLERRRQREQQQAQQQAQPEERSDGEQRTSIKEALLAQPLTLRAPEPEKAPPQRATYSEEEAIKQQIQQQIRQQLREEERRRKVEARKLHDEEAYRAAQQKITGE